MLVNIHKKSKFDAFESLKGDVKSNILDFGKSLFTDLAGDKEVKTTAIVMAVRALTGSDPIVDKSNPNVNVIKFSKTQRERLESYFDKKPTSKATGKPANVKIEHSSLWLPFAIKKALPYGLALAGVAFAIGRFSK